MPRPPLGIYHRDDQTPCWGFKTRTAFKKALEPVQVKRPSDRELEQALSGDVGYKLAADVFVREIDLAQFVNDTEPRLNPDRIADAMTMLLENKSSRDLLGEEEKVTATKECTTCRVQKPATRANFDARGSRLHQQCKECRKKYMNQRHAIVSEKRKAAHSFECVGCEQTLEEKFRSSEGTMCKECRTKEITANIKGKTCLGLFTNSVPENLIWVFKTAHMFYRLMDLRQQQFDRPMRAKGYWELTDDSPYVVRYIDDHTFATTSLNMVTFTDEDIAGAIKSGDELVGTRTDGPPVRRCTKCALVKVLPEFETTRSTCRRCRRDAENESKAQKRIVALELGNFTCTVCEQELPSSERCGDRERCKPCHNTMSTESVAERAKHIERDDTAGRDCACGRKFNPDEFRWQQTRWGSCKQCFNEKKYWESYRERFRTADPTGYLQYFAQQQARFRQEHPKTVEEYNTKRRTDPARRLRTIKQAAAARGITFQDEDALLEIIGLACHFCDALPDPEERMNGLNRVDRADGYNEGNVVPCCHLDSVMKGKMSPEDYVWRLCQINQVRRTHIPDSQLDVDMVISTNFGGCNKASIVGRRVGAKREQLHGRCYLCDHDGPVGRDRVDATLDYTEADNVRFCCWPCNRIKMDLPLTALYVHAWRVSSTFSESTDVALTRPAPASPETQTPQNREVNRNRWHPQWYGYTVRNSHDLKLVEKYTGAKELADALNTCVSSFNDRAAEGRPFIDDTRWTIEKVPAKTYNAMNEDVEHSEEFEHYLSTRTRSSRETTKYDESNVDNWLLVMSIMEKDVPIAKFQSVSSLARAVGVSDKAIAKQVERGKIKSRWPIRYVSEKEARKVINGPRAEEFIEAYHGEPGIIIYDGEARVAQAESLAELARIICAGMGAGTEESAENEKVFNKYKQAMRRAKTAGRLEKNGHVWRVTTACENRVKTGSVDCASFVAAFLGM